MKNPPNYFIQPGFITGPGEYAKFLDGPAEITCADVSDIEAVRTLYETDSRLQMSGTIHSYISTGMETIEMPLA
jgi:hypothetical protein